MIFAVYEDTLSLTLISLTEKLLPSANCVMSCKIYSIGIAKSKLPPVLSVIRLDFTFRVGTQIQQID